MKDPARLPTSRDLPRALLALAATVRPRQEWLDETVLLVHDLTGAARVAIYTQAPGVAVWRLAASTGQRFDSQREPAASPPPGMIAIPLADPDGVALGLLELDDPSLAGSVCEGLEDLLAVLRALLIRDRREQDLLARERRLIEAQRISRVGSYDFEMSTNTNLWSDQLYRIYGREPQSFNASYEKFLEMLEPEDQPHVIATHQHSLQTLEPFEMEERIIWPDGQVRTLASWGEVVTDDLGQPARMVGICWDVTERKLMEQQLVLDAMQDRLTELPNRALLLDRLTQALATLPQRSGSLGVLFLDVDRFKVINDSLGHHAGDEVLKELARRLTACLRPGDTVARFGGDEFVVLCQDLAHAGHALSLAQQIRTVLSAPLDVRGNELVVTVSIGIAIATGPRDLPGDLLRDADAAMYRAKKSGRAQSVVFSDEMRDVAMGRLETETQLRKAITNNGLRVHYQPIVDLATGTLVGFEALVRWLHPTRGLVSPAEFIPIAEETGLIVQLGAWVLDHACTQLASWQQHHPQHKDLLMTVNVSGLQIMQPDIVSQVADILARTGVTPSCVALEITESVLMRDAEDILTVLHDLQRLGVQLKVDDFGTGFSSLSYLKRFPVDALKIDQSFVSGLGTDRDDEAIVQAILALGRSLGMRTVAEGIETHQQLAALRAFGGELGQGFLFSRPKPAHQLKLILQRGQILPAGLPTQRDKRYPAAISSRL